jgi:hypothetical protein
LQAKVVCSFIGAQAAVDTSKHGGKNPLVEMAQQISFFRDDRDAELDRMRGPKVADRIEDDPRLQVHKPIPADPRTGQEADNAAGSFEAFLAMMGGGARPAMPGAEEAGGGDA